MLHLHALTLAKGVDAVKPLLHTGKQHDVTTFFHQALPGQGQAMLIRLQDHGIHIGQNTVNAVGPAKAVCLCPELLRRHAKAGDESIVLHIRGAEGLIKVIEQRDDGLLLFHSPAFRKKAAPESRFFLSRWYSCGQTSAR